MNKTLVLDVGGVLASNLTPGLWEQLASIGSCDQKHLYADYKDEVSEKLWCGQISEEQWWEWLSDRGVIVAEEQRSNLITNHLKPLPALELLPAWSQRCDIVIMSNHRTEWLSPLLSHSRAYIKNCFISDQAGMYKPSLDWFRLVDQHISTPVHFVDDSEKNISAAKQLGWQTTIADKHGKWTAAIDEWLRS